MNVIYKLTCKTSTKKINPNCTNMASFPILTPRSISTNVKKRQELPYKEK